MSDLTEDDAASTRLKETAQGRLAGGPPGEEGADDLAASTVPASRRRDESPDEVGRSTEFLALAAATRVEPAREIGLETGRPDKGTDEAVAAGAGLDGIDDLSQLPTDIADAPIMPALPAAPGGGEVGSPARAGEIARAHESGRAGPPDGIVEHLEPQQAEMQAGPGNGAPSGGSFSPRARPEGALRQATAGGHQPAGDDGIRAAHMERSSGGAPALQDGPPVSPDGPDSLATDMTGTGDTRAAAPHATGGPRTAEAAQAVVPERFAVGARVAENRPLDRPPGAAASLELHDPAPVERGARAVDLSERPLPGPDSANPDNLDATDPPGADRVDDTTTAGPNSTGRRMRESSAGSRAVDPRGAEELSQALASAASRSPEPMRGSGGDVHPDSPVEAGHGPTNARTGGESPGLSSALGATISDYARLTSALAAYGPSPEALPGSGPPPDLGPYAGEPHEQIVKAIRLQWTRGGGEARLQLQPEHLGEVSLNLRVEQGAVTALVRADNPVAAEWIRLHHADLQLSLESQGLTLRALEVVVDPERRRRQHQQEPPGPGARRRAGTQARFEVHA